jgi:hypothetical protein
MLARPMLLPLLVLALALGAAPAATAAWQPPTDLIPAG